MQPDTRYARSADGVNIAYQVIGTGERDLVLVPGWIFNIEVVWEHPAFEVFIRRLTKNFRVILFDKRGTGLSDRAPGASTMEERMDDVRAVMDAVGSEHAAILGWSEGGNIAVLHAATYPQRTDALILYASSPRYPAAPDFPWGVTPEFLAAGLDLLTNHWGEGLGAPLVAPSRVDEEGFVKWFGRYERLTVSPGEAIAMMKVNMEIDTTAVMSTIKVPTLVLHNVGDAFVPVECSRYSAERIPGAKLVELPGGDHLFWFNNPDDVVGEVEEFVLGARVDHEPDRVLATLLFTDIVGSTELAHNLGDARWRELLEQHDRATLKTVQKYRGRVVKNTGDGILATFDGPARAVNCAASLSEQLQSLGLTVRAGVHTGEVELRGDDIGGLAVNIGSRISAVAGPGEVLVSRTVKDLAAGGDISFTDRGEHELKGVDEPWRLYAATN